MFRNLSSRLLSSSILLSVGALLGTLFVPGTLPPAGMESSQFFYFLPLVGLLTFVTALRALVATPRLATGFRLGDSLVVALGLYAALRGASGGALPRIGVWNYLLLTVFYLDLRLCLSLGTRRDRRRIFRGIILLLLLAGLVQEIAGLRQLYGYGLSNHARFRVTGTFHNPAPLGGFLALVSGIALDRIVRLGRPLARYLGWRGWSPKLLLLPGFWIFGLSGLFLLGVLLLLPATQSRIAWLGALTALLIVGWEPLVRPLRRWLRERKWVAWVLVPLAGLVLVGGTTAAYRMKARSADGRLLMWKTTLRMVADRPWDGVGPGRFSGVYGDYQAAWLSSPHASDSERQVAGSSGAAFNDYLQLAAELGLPGLLLMVVVLFFAFRGFRRRWRSGGCGFAAALAAFSVFAAASYPLQLLSFRVLWMLLVAVGIGGLYDARPVSGVRAGDRIGSGVVLGFCLVVSALSFWTAWPLRRTYAAWGRLEPLYRMERFETVATDYERLAPALGAEPSFLFEWANVRNKDGDPTGSIAILERAAGLSSDPMLYNLLGNNYRALGDYPSAERAYLRAWAVVPGRLYPLYLLTDLYRESGQEARMRAMGRRVLEFDERVSSPAVREMRARVRKWLE